MKIQAKHLSLTLLLILALCLNVSAQKRQKHNVKVKYMNLPLKPLPSELKTYTQDFELNLEEGISRVEVKNALKRGADIPGFELVYKDGDMNMKVILEKFYIAGKELTEKKKKEKKGDEKVEVTYYYYTVTYDYPIYFQLVNNHSGETIDEGLATGKDNEYTYVSKKFRSEKQLEKDWEENHEFYEAKMMKNALDEGTKKLNHYIQDNYSYAGRERTITLYTFKPKKHNYDDYQKALELAWSALDLHSVDSVQNVDVRNALHQAVAIWEKALEESDLKSKKARVNKKITLKTHYNCVVAYYWLNDFENARKHLGEAWAIKKVSWFDEWKKIVLDREKRVMINFHPEKVEASNAGN